MKRVLYLGLELPIHLQTKNVVHCPLIKIIPRSPDDPAIRAAFESSKFNSYTHLLFTSKSAVAVFFSLAKSFNLETAVQDNKVMQDFELESLSMGAHYSQKVKVANIGSDYGSKDCVNLFSSAAVSKFNLTLNNMRCKNVIAIGQRTAGKLMENEVQVDLIANEETAEGIIEKLNPIELKKSHILLPQSSLARPVLVNWFAKHRILHTACPIYDTVPNIPKVLPNLTLFDEIVFTSPSVVNAFIQAFGSLPVEKTLTPIGPVTKDALVSFAKCTHG